MVLQNNYKNTTEFFSFCILMALFRHIKKNICCVADILLLSTLNFIYFETFQIVAWQGEKMLLNFSNIFYLFSKQKL